MYVLRAGVKAAAVSRAARPMTSGLDLGMVAAGWLLAVSHKLRLQDMCRFHRHSRSEIVDSSSRSRYIASTVP